MKDEELSSVVWRIGQVKESRPQNFILDFVWILDAPIKGCLIDGIANFSSASSSGG